jgi:2'-5' RNA ligase
VRLFFGIPLQVDAVAAARAAQEQLKAAAGGTRLGWTPPEQLHYTLAFLGESDPVAALGARHAGREAAQQIGAFDLSLGPHGVFPNAKRPRVLWIGAERGAPEMASLANALRVRLKSRGLPFDEKPFHAHATLARVKPPEMRAAARALESLPAAPGATQRVSDFVLFESRLRGSHGAEHAVVERFPLKGA